MSNEYKNTPLGSIPIKWEVKKFNEVITFMKSGLSRKLSEQDIGIPCIRSSNIVNYKISSESLKYWYLKDDKGADINSYMLDDGDILINFINSMSQIGKSCRYKNIGRDVIYTTNLFRIKVLEDLVNSDFFYYYTLTDYYNKEIGLITKPAVNQASFTSGDFKKIKMIVPPLEEQNKITKILSSVDNHIDEVDGMIADLKNLKKGLMQKLLTQGIGHTEFKDSAVGRIPVEWEVKRLGELLHVATGKKNAKDADNGGKYHFFTRALETQRINEYSYDTEALFIAGEGNFIVKHFDGKFDVHQRTYMLTQKVKMIDLKYLQTAIQPRIYKLVNNSVGSTVQSLRKPLIEELKLPIPSYEEQCKISFIMRIIEDRTTMFEDEVNQLNELKKALMQQLLTGKIRVKLDN